MIVRKPERTLTLELEKISIDEPIESARFDVPRVEADSRDVVGDSATQFERRIHMLLRRDAWHRAALACTDGSISGQLREKFASSMKPWHELVCHAQFDEWLTDSRPRIDEIVEYLRQKQKSGSSRDELDRIRSDQRSKLVAALDKLEASYTENLGVPELEAAAACAMQLLAVEREFAVNVFGELVRQPLLDEFDRATKTD
jgi:hypothetical protein